MTDKTNIVTITIERSKQYKSALRNNRYNWKWYYYWTADDNSHMVASGNRVVNIGNYGPGLVDLTTMLRRKYGRSAIIRKGWEPSQSVQ